MKQHNNLIEILERWYDLKSSGQKNDRVYSRIYEEMSPVIEEIVMSNKLYRYNSLSKDDYYEIANFVFFQLDRHIINLYERIIINGRDYFYRYCYKMVYNYIITRYRLRDRKEGNIPPIEELKETTKPKEWDRDFQEVFSTKERIAKGEMYEFLAADNIKNDLFQNMMKWSEWRGKVEDKTDKNKLLPTSHIQRSGLVSLDPGDSKLYANHLSLLIKYDLWMNHDPEARRMMWLALDQMTKSQTGSVSKPMVGAVLTDAEGNLISMSHINHSIGRDCCVYNLLEVEIEARFIKEKVEISNQDNHESPAMGTVLNLRDPILYITMEPSPKGEHDGCSCIDRIIYSGIKTVYIGLKNPQRSNAGAGAVQLKAAGIKIKYFYQDFILEIIKAKNSRGEMQNLNYIREKQKFYMEEQPDLFHHIILQNNPTAKA